MWLGLRLAAGRAKMPSDALLVGQLGSPEAARQYKRWVRDYPEVERGPDQEISAHFQALKAAFEQENAEVGEKAPAPRRMREPTPDLPSRRVKPSWVRSPQELVAEQVGVPLTTDLKGMPQRIPGWFTGDSVDKSPPGYEVPNPLPRRDPGLAVRPYQVPPSRPTHEEWVRSLAEKGIHLNPDGTRMAPPVRSLPPRGHDIWADLVDRKPEYQPRHRAAKVVIAYVTSVLGSDDYVARWYKRHNAMTGLGWEFHESGTGNSYEKEINGKRHRIVGDSVGDVKGWMHYADGEIPQFYDNIGDAVLHSMRGHGMAGFSVGKRPAIEDSSYHPDRAELTRQIGKMIPPAAKGKHQTLSTWESGA